MPKSIYQAALSDLVKVIRLLESKRVGDDVPENVGNWITQLLGNDRLKNKVDIVAEIATKKLNSSIENFQPARKLDNTKPETIWSNVSEISPSDYLHILESGDIPAAIEAQECMSLVTYFVVSNIYGKPLSAVSGGRSLAALTILDAVKPKAFSLTIHDLYVGGNKKTKYDLSLGFADVKKILDGGMWRANIVLALPSGSKHSSSKGGPVLVGW